MPTHSHNELYSESKKIIVGFGDIRGFGHWLSRNTTSIEDVTKFISKTYSHFVTLGRKRDYFIKHVGDGVMIAKQLNRPGITNSDIVTDVLKDCLYLTDRVHEDIKDLPYPRPNGWRMRLVSGYSMRILFQNQKGRVKEDYLGYNVNFAHRLLSVSPRIQIICHETVKEIVNGKCRKNGLRFDRLDSSKVNCPDDIDQEDLDALWSVSERLTK